MKLIDLHCNWALQYAGESTQYDASHYAEALSSLEQAAGYLSGVSAAILACGRSPDDWKAQATPWAALEAMIARYEAEFPGRLLMVPEDARRWLAEPRDAMCWGVLAVEGLDFLVRAPADLDRLVGLFKRGVRVFQIAQSAAGLLAGADQPGDDRGLTDLGRATLERLESLVSAAAAAAAVPVLDIAGLGARATSDVLDWFEGEPSRPRRLILTRTHGAIKTESSADCGLEPDSLRRFRLLGGVLGLSVGPPFASSPEALRRQIELAAAMPLGARPGYEGIGIGTDFLKRKSKMERLSTALQILEWIKREFTEPARSTIAFRSGRSLIVQLTGLSEYDPEGSADQVKSSGAAGR